jgi:hypothetical protein
MAGNGSAGTVQYQWVRRDNRGTVIVPEPSITLLAGDTGTHALATDTWSPNSAGSEQLVILSGSLQPAAVAFTCR